MAPILVRLSGLSHIPYHNPALILAADRLIWIPRSAKVTSGSAMFPGGRSTTEIVADSDLNKFLS